jgi:hypothetical protein
MRGLTLLPGGIASFISSWHIPTLAETMPAAFEAKAAIKGMQIALKAG